VGWQRCRRSGVVPELRSLVVARRATAGNVPVANLGGCEGADLGRMPSGPDFHASGQRSPSNGAVSPRKLYQDRPQSVTGVGNSNDSRCDQADRPDRIAIRETEAILFKSRKQRFERKVAMLWHFPSALLPA